MPWGWECRERLVKQKVPKPTVRRASKKNDVDIPAPNYYDTPTILGGKGYSNIKKLPAYTFGYRTKLISKPATARNAPIFNVCGMGNKGIFRIPGSVVTPRIEPPASHVKIPGPAAYAPPMEVQYKRAPKYTAAPVARPKYQPWDQWTPPPNMYLPPMMDKRPPAYTFGNYVKPLSRLDIPGPGTHEPNFNFVRKTKPAFSFGAPARTLKPHPTPAPNTYCEKKFKYTMKTIPAPTFGIRHTPYLGVRPEYLKSSKLELSLRKANGV